MEILQCYGMGCVTQLGMQGPFLDVRVQLHWDAQPRGQS